MKKIAVWITTISLLMVSAQFANAILGFGKQKSNESDSVWTDWYNRGFILGTKWLYFMRDRLNKNNVFEFENDPETVICPENSDSVRTADGSCNDENNPLMGKAETRFGRTVPVEDTYTDFDNLMKPNPRLVSIKLLQQNRNSPGDKGIFKPDTTLNLLAGAWIQFVIHDWVSHGENEITGAYALPPPKGVFDPFGNGVMLIPATKVDHRPPTSSIPSDYRTYKNEVTPWFDAGQIYGNNLETQKSLRTMTDGKLIVRSVVETTEVDGKTVQSVKNRLPIAENGVENTGFRRNWWLGLSLLHNLFVLEHNRIVDELMAQYSDRYNAMDPKERDQELFDKARLINSAIIAKIHTMDWTPGILAHPTIKKGMSFNWTGNGLTASDDVKSGLLPEMLGVVGKDKKMFDQPYSLTEEFVSVYRMHPLLVNEVNFVSTEGKQLASVPLNELREEKSHAVSDNIPMKDLLYSFGRANPGQLTVNNYPDFMSNLQVEGLGDYIRFDMGAVDVFRDRERGVPRYNKFRRLMHLKPLTKIEQITDDTKVQDALNEVYGGDIELVDLLVGCLAESHRPTGFGFGETTFQLFLLTATRRLQTDKFFTTHYNASVYTQKGLDLIDQANMKTVLLHHYPELAPSLEGIDNAFSPWKAPKEAKQ